jgi:hypothetical protein
LQGMTGSDIEAALSPELREKLAAAGVSLDEIAADMRASEAEDEPLPSASAPSTEPSGSTTPLSREELAERLQRTTGQFVAYKAALASKGGQADGLLSALDSLQKDKVDPRK